MDQSAESVPAHEPIQSHRGKGRTTGGSGGASGDGWFGRVAIAIWAVGVGAIVVATLSDTLFAVKANFLLPVSGVGQIVGSLLTSVAVVRARRWT